MLQEKNKSNRRRGVVAGKRADKSVRHPAFKALVALNIIGAIVAAYLYFNGEKEPLAVEPATQETVVAGYTPAAEVSVPQRSTTVNRNFPAVQQQSQKPIVHTQPGNSGNVSNPTILREPAPSTNQKLAVGFPAEKITNKPVNENNDDDQITENISYTVSGPQVYFHNRPDESTRRNAFINRWNKAVLKPLDEKNGFVYIVYTNPWGQTSRGWMLKKHLTPLN